MINLLKNLNYPIYLNGAIKKRSIVTNAQNHVSKKYVYNVDIKKYFPSISKKRVFEVFSKHLECSPKVSRLLADITTHSGYLPQGSHTSSALANLVMHFIIIPEIKNINGIENCTITTYIDDITTSFNDDNLVDITKKIRDAIQRAGFNIHPFGMPGKNKLSCNGEKKMVTGLVINTKIGVPKKKHDQLRAKYHILKENCESLPESEITKLKNSIKGDISFISQIDPSKAKKMKQQLLFNSKKYKMYCKN